MISSRIFSCTEIMLISLKFPRASFMPFLKTETMCTLWDFFHFMSFWRHTLHITSVGFLSITLAQILDSPMSTLTHSPPCGSAVPSHPSSPPMLLVVFLTAASDTLQQPWLLQRREGGIPGFPAPGAAPFLWEAQDSPSKCYPAWLCLPRGKVSDRGCSVNSLQGSNLILSKWIITGPKFWDRSS